MEEDIKTFIKVIMICVEEYLCMEALLFLKSSISSESYYLIQTTVNVVTLIKNFFSPRLYVVATNTKKYKFYSLFQGTYCLSVQIESRYIP